MRLTILEDRRLRNTLQTNAGPVVIGSDPKCHIHLPDPRLGTSHASLMQDDAGDWWLEVTEAVVPTCVNRAIQRTRTKLRHADEIEILHYSIRLFLESEKSREELRRERMQTLMKQYDGSLPLESVVQKHDEPITLSQDLLEQFTLLAIRLAQIESIKEALPPVLKAVLRTFDGRRAWIGVRREAKNEFDWTMGLTDKGVPCDRPAFSQTAQTRCLDMTQSVCAPNVHADTVGSAMATPIVCSVGTLGMLYVENDPGNPSYDEKILQAMKAMSSCVTIPIENILRQTTAKRRAAAVTEQTVARATQDSLTPKALPHWDELQIAAYRHMGSARCCDYYDVVQLRDRTAAIVVAKIDVEGISIPRYFSELRATFRSAALYSEAPHLFARAVNWMLYSGDGRSLIHMVTAWIHPQNGHVQYCATGTGVQIGRLLADGECELIKLEDAPPVCKVRAPTFEAHQMQLDAGDSLVLATDGVMSTVNANGEAFGFENLKETLSDGLGDTPSHVLNEFGEDLIAFLKDGKCPDDVTVVLVRRE